MNYADTVEKVMSLLKEKKVCSSSRKSHRDCYESLGSNIEGQVLGRFPKDSESFINKVMQY